MLRASIHYNQVRSIEACCREHQPFFITERSHSSKCVRSARSKRSGVSLGGLNARGEFTLFEKQKQQRRQRRRRRRRRNCNTCCAQVIHAWTCCYLYFCQQHYYYYITTFTNTFTTTFYPSPFLPLCASSASPSSFLRILSTLLGSALFPTSRYLLHRVVRARAGLRYSTCI
jgi:hypothetical protein